MSAHWPRLSGLPDSHLTSLRFRHAEPWRQYHVWDHVEALFAELSRVEGRLHDARAVAVAVLYHDAVYDPRSTHNEHYSAELLASECAGILPTECLDAAAAMVRATQGHALPGGLSDPDMEDMAHFLDADLAILGAAPAAFDAYEAAIRREYAHVPEAEFRRARAAVLQHFLARPAIYFSAAFREAYETGARDNLRRSLRKLG